MFSLVTLISSSLSRATCGRDPRLAGHSPGAARPHPHRPRPPASRLLNRQASPNPPASAARTITGPRSPAARPAADEATYPARSEGGLDGTPLDRQRTSHLACLELGLAA